MLRKKRLQIVIIMLTICLSPLLISATGISTGNENLRTLRFLKIESYIDITYDENDTFDPIIPNDEIRYIPLNVTYGVTHGMLGGLLLRLLQGRQLVVNLDVFEVPTWCTAAINPHNSTVVLSGEPSSFETVLSVQVEEDAPALQQFDVEINVTAEPIIGRFGKIALVSGYQSTFNVPFSVDYLPIIDIDLLSPAEQKISPVNITTIPINITNLGNGVTNVSIEHIDHPQNWTITNPAGVTIPVGETKQVTVNILPDKSFENETIRLKFVPRFSTDFSKEGEPLFITLILENDGSLKEKEETPGFELLTFLVACGFLSLILRKKIRINNYEE